MPFNFQQLNNELLTNLKIISTNNTSLIVILLPEIKNYYFQFYREVEKGDLYCEAVCNTYLEDAWVLDNIKNDILISHGFKLDDNFQKYYSLNCEEDFNSIVDEVIKLFESVYAATADSIFKIEIVD